MLVCIPPPVDMKRVGVVPDVPVMKVLLEAYGIRRDARAMYVPRLLLLGLVLSTPTGFERWSANM